jgi:hypothetical protein
MHRNILNYTFSTKKPERIHRIYPLILRPYGVTEPNSSECYFRNELKVFQSVPITRTWREQDLLLLPGNASDDADKVSSAGWHR